MGTNDYTSMISVLSEYKLLDVKQLGELSGALREGDSEPQALSSELVKRGWMTPFQVEAVLSGQGANLVLGQYILMDLLGEGGMSQVFKARHRLMHRVVAVKVIRPQHPADKATIRRFRREIRAAAKLSHPNVVIAHDAAQEGNTLFFVMEYVEGVDLAKLVQRRGPLPIGEACDCIRQAALGLQHAFEQGLVHRDIKPSNLLLSAKEGVVKVLDLGLARLQQTEANGHSGALTRAGAVVGTPDYMAPEQAEDSRRVDIRADLYSLGCTFYYLLTGQPPFPQGTLFEKLFQHKTDEPAAVEQLRPETPVDVLAVLRKLMAKKPETRFPTPKDLSDALEPLSQRVTPGAAWASVPEENTEPVLSATPMISYKPVELPSHLEPALSLANLQRSAAQRDESLTPVGLSALPRLPVAQSSPQPAPASEARKRNRGLLLLAVLVFLGIGIILGMLWWRMGPTVPEQSQQIVVVSTPSTVLTVQTSASSITDPEKAPEKKNSSLHENSSHPAPKLPPTMPAPSPPPVAPIPPTPSEKVGLVGRLEGHKAGVRCVTFSPDDTRALSCGMDNTMLLWNLESHREEPINFDGNIEDLIWSVVFSFDGRYALSGCGGKLDGTQVRLGGDNVLLLWDLRTRRVVRSFKGHKDAVRSVALSHGGRYAVSGSHDRTVRVWDVDTTKTVAECKGHTAPVRSVAFARDGDRVASGGDDNTVRLWDAKTGKQLLCLTGHLKPVTSVAFTPDGRRIVSASLDKTVRLWDVNTKSELGRFEGHSDGVWCVAVSPNGELAVSGGSDNVVRLWELNGFQEIKAFAGHTKPIMSVAFANDGRHVLSGSDDQSIRLWALPQASKP